MSWKYAWRYRWKVFAETVTSAIHLLDTSMTMYSSFCSSESQRNRHILAIVLLMPFFLVGILGVIGEWMTIMDNRKAGRKNRYKSLIVFSVMMQASTALIFLAMQC